MIESHHPSRKSGKLQKSLFPETYDACLHNHHPSGFDRIKHPRILKILSTSQKFFKKRTFIHQNSTIVLRVAVCKFTETSYDRDGWLASIYSVL
jgi:hypothetical protein